MAGSRGGAEVVRFDERLPPDARAVPMLPTEPFCFVVMPFTAKLAGVFQTAIRPAVEQAAAVLGEPLVCFRGDDFHAAGSITRDIVESIHRAKVVVADLSGNNANVFYELGLAHAFGNKTFMITGDVKAVPFDVQSYRIVPYSVEGEGLEVLRGTLVAALVAFCQGRLVASNPVSDFAPIRHSSLIAEIAQVIEIERRVRAEVCLIIPTMFTDQKYFADVIRTNVVARGVRYKYILPNARHARRDWDRLTDQLGPEVVATGRLTARFVDESFIESEVVIYDPMSPTELALIMSPHEEDVPFFYHLRGSVATRVRRRFEDLWELAKPVSELRDAPR